jgi:hypothetical protein
MDDAGYSSRSRLTRKGGKLPRPNAADPLRILLAETRRHAGREQFGELAELIEN